MRIALRVNSQLHRATFFEYQPARLETFGAVHGGRSEHREHYDSNQSCCDNKFGNFKRFGKYSRATRDERKRKNKRKPTNKKKIKQSATRSIFFIIRNVRGRIEILLFIRQYQNVYLPKFATPQGVISILMPAISPIVKMMDNLLVRFIDKHLSVKLNCT